MGRGLNRPTYFILALVLGLSLTFGIPLSAQFVANQGQWKGSFDFRAELSEGALFFGSHGYRLAWLRIPHEHGAQRHRHPAKALGLEMQFAGSRAVSPRGSQKMATYQNFFLGEVASNWHSRVPQYRSLQYPELYPGISVHFQALGGDLKYDIHLAAGADPRQIKQVYRGQDALALEKGRLQIITPLGTLVEKIPLAYQIVAGKKVPVDCHYRLKGDTVSYLLDHYRPDLPLVIDPQLVFAGFSGSGDLNFGNSATFGDAGSTYAAGVNFGANYPVTLGAFQSTFASDSSYNVDVVISKFDSSGQKLLYATYFGGQDVDLVHSIVSDKSGNLVLLGSTGSPDLPISNSAYQRNFQGGPTVNSFAFNNFDLGIDAYVAKLSADGSQLLASTYWGGSQTDGYNLIEQNYGDHFRGEVIIDEFDNIAVTIATRSPDLPLTNPLGHVKSLLDQDAAIAIFSPQLDSQLWSRWYGGTGQDAPYSLRHRGQYLYVVGGTNSSDLPLADTALAYESQALGDLDGFIARFDYPSGNLLQGSYYGTGQMDQCFFIDLDRQGNIFLFGQTKGNLPITAGRYGVPAATQFVSKMTGDLQSLHWQTTVGSGQAKQDLVPTAFMVDQCQNIYLSGWNGKANMVGFPSLQNGNTNGLPVSDDAFQSTTDGSDFYLMVLGREAEQVNYASFLGGTDNEHVDGGTSRFNKTGVVYQAVCSNCNNRGFPTTSGVYALNAGAPTCNMAVFKFRFNQILKANAQINFTTEIDSVCDALVVNFANHSQNATHFRWYFGNGDSSSAREPSTIYDRLGQYTVTMVAFDSICGVNDTLSIPIQHRKASKPEAKIKLSYQACDARYQAVFDAGNSLRSQHYEWHTGDGHYSKQKNFVYQYRDRGPHMVTLVALDTICQRRDTTQSEIYFRDTITPLEVGIGFSSCSNGQLDIELKNHQSWYQYFWETEGLAYKGIQPTIRFDIPGTKKVALLVMDTLCNREFSWELEAELEELKPTVYIPNAFTPNGDKLNDQFTLFGEPCQPGESLRIFNRWGQLVFESNRPFKEFWDGFFQGRPAPSGVYSYILLNGGGRQQGTFTLVR